VANEFGLLVETKVSLFRCLMQKLSFSIGTREYDTKEEINLD